MIASSYTGIALALLSATSYNVGLIQEKRALGRMPALDLRRVPHMIASLLADPAWLAGVALVLVLSRLVLRERLGAVEFWCVAAMAVSVILLAASAGQAAGGAGHHVSPGWMAAVAIPSVVIGLLVGASPLRSRSPSQRAPAAGVCFGIGTGLLYGVAALAIKGLSGILVGHHGAEHLAAGIVASPYLYVLAGCSAAAMLLYQVALQTCRASIVIPVSNVTGSVYFIIAGTWLV